MQKCSIGEATAMSGQLTCSEADEATKVASAIIAAQVLASAKMKNPHDTAQNAVKAGALGACTKTNKGQIGVLGVDLTDLVTIAVCTGAAEGTVTNKLTESIKVE